MTADLAAKLVPRCLNNLRTTRKRKMADEQGEENAPREKIGRMHIDTDIGAHVTTRDDE